MSRTAKTSGSVRSKGQKGEREVVARYRANGYPDAVRSPGSGALRSSGAGSLSPWPGDLARVRPWLVEVKRDERSHATGEKVQRTWPGSTFIRKTLRDLDQLARFHEGMTTPRVNVVPVLWVRGGQEPWRVVVRDFRFRVGIGAQTDLGDIGRWVEVPEWFYWEHIVPPVRDQA